MAIEAGWDPEVGSALPWELTESDLEFLGWHAPLCRELLEHLFPGEDRRDPAGPAWAVPGVPSAADELDEEGVSPASRALLDEIGAAVSAQRLAGARMYRAITAIRRSDVLAETGYRRLARLLEDHVRLDPKIVVALERQAYALYETVTPTAAITPAELPATAVQVDDGVIDERHVEIVRTTMRRLRTVPDLEPAVLGVAEEQLAALAASRSPQGLQAAAKVIADRLDPDGAAPVDDTPAGNELHYTKRRNGHLAAKLMLRDPAAVALFDDAIRAATPAPASAVCADPVTGLPPVTEDGGSVGVDPRAEARDSKPARQACGLLDLVAASHRAGLDHTDAEQRPGSLTTSTPLPDLDEPGNHGDTTGRATEDLPATDATATDATATADVPAHSDETTKDGESPRPGAGPPDPEPPPPEPPPSEPPPHRPWTPPDVDAMALSGRERVILTVTLEYETLRQQVTDTSQALALLGDSTWIRPETARRLACDAEVIPMVLGSKGEVLDVGRKTRSIPTATGRAVVQRDRHCAFPGCRRRARTSEIHHIQHWADLGETEPDNVVCLCRHHHDLVHHSGWQVRMIDHLPWFIPPPWLDPTRRPRHNRPWHVTGTIA